MNEAVLSQLSRLKGGVPDAGGGGGSRKAAVAFELIAQCTGLSLAEVAAL